MGEFHKTWSTVCSRFHECNSAMCVSACCTHSFMHAACYPSYLSLADSIVSKYGQFWLQKQKLCGQNVKSKTIFYIQFMNLT